MLHRRSGRIGQHIWDGVGVQRADLKIEFLNYKNATNLDNSARQREGGGEREQCIGED